MIYNFSKFFKNNSDSIFKLFIQNYTSHVDAEETKTSKVYSRYKVILFMLEKEFKEDSFLQEFRTIALENAMNNVPYIMLINEVHNLQSLLIQKIIDDTSNEKIMQFMELFKKTNNAISKIFLFNYIDKMLSQNNVRINSLADLIDKNIIRYYEAHLIWINDLAKCIQENDRLYFPELSANMCDFGKWLQNDGKKVIHNNSKYKSIVLLHDNLHLFGEKIFEAIALSEYNITMTYLEKCEFISLSIGTELALIDNIVMNKQVTKDKLTGALNRQALEHVFESQYELSLATNNHFVLAMCDLDYFKIVNDTYGHIAGDTMLKHFVSIVQKNIRNSDVIIRYGGEEFILMLPAICESKGLDILNKIRLEFAQSNITFKNQTIQTTVSIGMMELKPHKYYKKIYLNDYIDIVDQKLYQAKNNGRNRVEVF